MTQLIKYTCILFLTGMLSISAQEFQGVATYKSKRKIDIKMDSTKINSQMQTQMLELFKKQFEKTHILTFNKQASVYKEDVSLGRPSTPGIEIMVVGTGDSDVLYKNTKEKRITNKSDIMGKLFLIQDKLESQDWKLTKETKNIGKYTCYKAIQTMEIDSSSFSNLDTVSNKDSISVEKKKLTITAWYAPEIAVSHGPSRYWGLPGLILEVNDGDNTIVCSKIVLNPKEQKEIVEPKKGKQVTQDEYNAIIEKKTKEMKSRYPSGSEDGSSFTFEIRD